MVETVTAHYGWTKPEITHSASTWGGFLNNDLDSIDALVFANQQGIVPVGAIQMFGGATAPANWLICDGRSLDTTAYAALFAVLGYAHGGGGTNFNLPNLQGVFPLGAGPTNALGSAAGSYNYTLDVAHLPAHAHPIVDVAHNHGVNVNQSPHTHTDSGHAHNIHEPSVNFPGGGVASGTGWGWIDQNTSPGVANIQGANANVSVSLNASGTGLSTTQNVGSGAAMSIVPQYVALNFIIRCA